MTSTSRRILAGLLTAAILAVGFGAAPALAQSANATNLGTFNSWTAWKATDASGLLCYISSDPTKSEPTQVNGKAINRDPPHFLILHRKGLGIRNEAQTLIGYPFSKEKAPTVSIDGKTYPMMSENAAAWLAVEADQPGFVTAMKAGTTLTVSGTSLKGTNTTDTYSLAGVTKAMAAIDAACQ